MGPHLDGGRRAQADDGVAAGQMVRRRRSPTRPTRPRPTRQRARSASSASPTTALYILGYASETPNQTLLVYDAPILSLQVSRRARRLLGRPAHIVNGTLNGMPYAGLDTYKISVDARGTAVLPFLSFDNTLRVHVDLTPDGAGRTLGDAHPVSVLPRVLRRARPHGLGGQRAERNVHQCRGISSAGTLNFPSPMRPRTNFAAAQ